MKSSREEQIQKEFEILHKAIVEGNSELLVAEYWKFVYYRVKKLCVKYKVTCEKEDVEELRNEIFLRMLDNDCEKLKKYDPQKGLLLIQWICVIISNTFIDIILRKKDPESLSSKDKKTQFDESPHITDYYEARRHWLTNMSVTNKLAFKEALSSIPAIYAKVISGYMDGKSFENIAEELGKSKIAVQTYKHRAFKKLKSILNS